MSDDKCIVTECPWYKKGKCIEHDEPSSCLSNIYKKENEELQECSDEDDKLIQGLNDIIKKLKKENEKFRKFIETIANEGICPYPCSCDTYTSSDDNLCRTGRARKVLG